MICETVFALSLFFIYQRYFIKPFNMPPGTFGIPIIGNLPLSRKPITKHLEEMKKKYGPVFTTKWGSFPIVVIADYDTLFTHFYNFATAGRPKFYSFDKFSYSKPGGIILSEDEIWKNNRKFLLKNLKNLPVQENFIENEAEKFVEYLENMDLENPIEMDWSINVAVLNIIWQMLANKRYEPDDPFIIEFTKNATEDLEIIQGPMLLLDIMPWLSKLPSFLYNKITRNEEFLKHRSQFKNLSMEIIKEHEETLDPDYPRDIVDSYLLEMKNLKDGPNELRNYDDLLILMNDMFFAGSESTASTLRWFVLYMATHPEVQDKIQNLLDTNVPKDRLPSLQDRPNLLYLEAAIYETLRCSSFVKIGLFHKTLKDMKIKGHHVPKGTLLLGPLELFHRDPLYWKKPYEFYPEHFLTNEGTLDAKPDGFVPFSLGRRRCPGDSIAKRELFIFTSALLQRFRITPPEGITLDTSTDNSKYMLNHAKPYKVKLTKRL